MLSKVSFQGGIVHQPTSGITILAKFQAKVCDTTTPWISESQEIVLAVMVFTGEGV